MASRDITQLPDRFTGELNDIRDKKIAEANDASSASDITSQCKFLLENGQTGEFMNVLKSYIDESVRSALGPLLNNLDKGTGLKAVAGIDSNNDLGTATLSNLASMLSVADLTGDKSSKSDLNDHVSGIGIYRVSPGTHNIPSAASSGNGVLLVFMLEEGHMGFQFYSDIATGAIWTRTRYFNNGGQWTNWR